MEGINVEKIAQEAISAIANKIKNLNTINITPIHKIPSSEYHSNSILFIPNTTLSYTWFSM